MKRWFSVCVTALALSIGAASGAQAGTLTFDDLPGNGSPIPNGYGGFNWTNMWVLNGDTYSGNPSGYQNGVVSHSNVAFNAFGSPASLIVSSNNAFTFNSTYLTAAWNDGLHVEVQGYNGATLLYDTTVTVDTSGPTLETFDYQNITQLVFTSSGGVNHGYVGSGEHFAMDNFTYNQSVQAAVPVPPTVTMLGMGIVSLFGYGWRKRKQAA
jgi:hypothetical protein